MQIKSPTISSYALVSVWLWNFFRGGSTQFFVVKLLTSNSLDFKFEKILGKILGFKQKTMLVATKDSFHVLNQLNLMLVIWL